MRASVIVGIAVITIALGIAPLFGAFNTGDILGQVLDPSGAVVPNTRIAVTSQETGERRELQTDGIGRFAVNQLKIGAYRAQAEAFGFRVAVTTVAIRSGEVAVVTLRLELGEVTETVNAVDALTPLNAVRAQQQMSIGDQLAEDLPVNRNPIQFATLSPGVVPVAANNPFLSSAGYNSNGGRGRGNNLTIDSINANDVQTTGSTGLGSLSFAAIKEVKVITHNFDAEFGRNGNSQLQFITRSGTNNFHGEAYEFLQNDKLNARDFFDRTGQPAITRVNQFGYTVGGPIRRNRTHFFQAYEGFQRRGAGATRIALVPSPAMLAEVRDPAARQLLDQYQLPAATSSTATSGQVEQSATNLRKAFLFSLRVDHQIGDRDSLMVRYGHSQLTSISSSNTFINTNLANFGIAATDGPRNLGLAETHLFSPTIVNEFRFAVSRSAPVFPLVTTVPLGPRVIFQNGQVSTFGAWESAPQGRVQNVFQYSDTVTWFHGAHNVKAGADLYRYQANSSMDSLQRPRFMFANWSDFANGLPSIYQQFFGSSDRGHRITTHFYFLQDDWKIRRNLTLSLGLRTEVAGGVGEVNGLISNLDLNCHDSLGAAGTGPLGCFSTGRPSFHTNVNWGPRLGFSWNPRGDGKTVVRGGYGIAYDFLYLNPIVNARFLPPFIYSATLSGAGAFTGDNSFARLVAGTAPIQQQGQQASGRLDTTLLNYGTVNPAIDENLRNPQVQQWSLSLERRLGSQLVLRAAYVGSKGNYLQRSHQINLVQDSRAAPATSLADETARLASFLAVNTARSGTPTRPSDRFDPRFNDVALLDSSANSNYHSLQLTVQKQFDHGYYVQASYTFSKSIDDVSDALNVLANDDSGQQNPRNNRDNRAVSEFDIPQRLVIAHYWEPPWGRHLSHPAAHWLAQGWGVSGVSTFQSGFPATFDSGTRRGIAPLTLAGGANLARVNTSGPFGFNPLPAGSAGSPAGLNTDPIQPISAYAASLGLSQPLIGNFGSLGRNAVRLNGAVNFDWALYKNTQLTERFRLQLRGEFYNLFNNTSFGGPTLNIGAATFGQYTRTDNLQRFVQLGARVVF
jgi:hypothetical protein